MRPRAVLRYLGLLSVSLGLFMLIPLAFSIYHQESDSVAFGISTALSILTGLVLWRLNPLEVKKLYLKEVLVIVALGWVIASLFSSIAYMASGVLPNFIDAFFESASGYTTTGATVLSSLDAQPHGILLWRSMTQWLGGLGIIMFFVVLFPMIGAGASQLVVAETPGQQGDKLTSRIRDTFKVLWVLYILLTLAELVLLEFAGMPLFDAFTISLSTTATGGFAPTDLSIAAYNSPIIEGIIILFMVAAGVNFGLYYLFIWKRQPRSLFGNSEFKLYIAILVIATIAINVDLVVNMGLPFVQALRESSFQTASLVTTTGFATADFNAWPTFARSATLVLMVFGASAGSTGGALKIVRLLVLVKYAYQRVLKILNPKRVILLKVNNKVVPESVISKVAAMTILYFLTIWMGFLVMSAIGLDFETALSSVTSCLGNVGPGLNMVGPMENYIAIPILGKVMLIFFMLAGRVELFTFYALFVPSFWKWD